MQNTEPKEVSEIVADVMAGIREKIQPEPTTNFYRMNKTYETATPMRETAIAKPARRVKLDYEVGDIVQIKNNGKSYVGRVGMIIGIKYGVLGKGKETLLYSVKFSDKESDLYATCNLSLVKANTAEI